MFEMIAATIIGLVALGLEVVFLYFQITGMKEFDE